MLLRLENLSVCVGSKPLVQNVNLAIAAERIVGLVGGSGSGKTTTALAILRLLPAPLEIASGKIIFQEKDLLKFPEERLRPLRGKEIAMVFQEPLHALNPVMKIGDQIDEVFAVHTELKSRQRQERIYELLERVGIREPKRVASSYPHQLSGGLRQRAMIAQAIALKPRLIIADEPTSNLDVTVQARIIELFQKLRMEMKISFLLIAHDLGLVRYLADEVAVMENGRVVESGPTATVLGSPRQVYTQQLLKAVE